MEEILSRSHYRRAFYVVILLIIGVSLLLRFALLPYFDESLAFSFPQFLAALTDTLVISLVITVAIGSFVFWLTPDIVKRSPIDVVEPKQIGPLLKSATSNTGSWIYKGACGRYTRASTLPRLADSARSAGIGRDISIYILNPGNETLCKQYATYRRSLKSAQLGKEWTLNSVREELLATAVSALRYSYTEPLLRIRLFFLDNFSAFRLDVSDLYVIVTKEDKQASALKADQGTYFYDSYKDDIRLAERQAKEMTCCGRLEFKGEISEDELREAVRCAELVDEATLNGLDIDRILKCINTPNDPY